MSTLGDALSGAVPYLVTLAAAGLGYVGGLRPGRESRQQGRVEVLYQEILSDLTRDFDDALRAAGVGYYEDVPPYSVTEHEAIRARVELFASSRVASAWHQAKQAPGALRMTADSQDYALNVDTLRYLMEEAQRSREGLIREMRHELRVERVRLGPVRQWLAQLRRGRKVERGWGA